MKGKPEISIGFGAGAGGHCEGNFDDLYTSSLVRDLRAIETLFAGQINVDWIPYEGLDDKSSLLSHVDHRPGLPIHQMNAAVSGFNSNGLKFNIALNGLYDHSTRDGERPVDLKSPAFNVPYRALSHSAEMSAKYGVKNIVTTYLNKFRIAIEDLFPGIFTQAASCTKFAGGWDDQFQGLTEIERACRDHALVVLMPQQTYADIIETVRAYVDKLVVFPFSMCASEDIYRCFAHNRGFSVGDHDSDNGEIDVDWGACAQIFHPALPEWMPRRKDFSGGPISSEFLAKRFGNECSRPGYSMKEHFAHLEALMKTYGLHRFKIAREFPLIPANLIVLIDTFAKVQGLKSLGIDFTDG